MQNTLRLDPYKVAKFLGRSKEQLYRQMKEGKLPIGEVYEGNTLCHYIILKNRLEEYLAMSLSDEQYEWLKYVKRKRKGN